VVVALLREAYHALPNGTAREKTEYIMRRRSELERGVDSQPASLRKTFKLIEPGFTQVTEQDLDAALARLSGNVKPFSAVANDPAVVRTSERDE
jgi:hypothetical protein